MKEQTRKELLIMLDEMNSKIEDLRSQLDYRCINAPQVVKQLVALSSEFMMSAARVSNNVEELKGNITG